ncbi:outer membrane protein TolC [Prosthecobacter fusiformis]|uniref:Outer membrane protein TolC n=1 Tax=Prosthecobacter fusiformis TaxID=48464 RepID=A0A4V3FFJ5_9BACT|nr:TolC family protein [Prosthecobacter fusiformis]TDU71063.1 outer membrane protein TolC [Prosthecobacter fusiformis]
MHRRLLILSCLVAVSSTQALTLSDIAPRVRSHHPQLKAARMAVEEARGRQLGAGRLSNPSLGFEFQNESRVSPRSSTFSLDQSFPITRRLTLEKQLTSQLVTAAELEVKDAERNLIAEARSLAVKLLSLEKQRALRQQQTQLAQELSSFAKERADAGELSPLDAAQAQVDAQRLQLEARRIQIETVTLQGALKPMLGLSPAASLKLTGDLPALTLPGRSAWQQRADYQLAQAKTQAAQTDAALAHARRYQDVSAGLFAAREQQDVSSSSTEHTGFIGFRFSIPLPLWNRNQGEIAEKTASIERARLESEALASQITSEAETARQEMQANAALVTETRDRLLPLVKEQTDKLETAYQTGQTDLLTVLRARDQRLQLEAAVLDASRDFHLARIRYEAAVGSMH